MTTPLWSSHHVPGHSDMKPSRQNLPGRQYGHGRPQGRRRSHLCRGCSTGSNAGCLSPPSALRSVDDAMSGSENSTAAMRSRGARSATVRRVLGRSVLGLDQLVEGLRTQRLPADVQQSPPACTAKAHRVSTSCTQIVMVHRPQAVAPSSHSIAAI